MLKKFIPLLLLAPLLFAQDFIELENKISGAKNSLIEAFSYQCIHCYNHHKFKTLQKLKNKVPDLRYELYPVSLSDAKYGEFLNEFFAYAIHKDRLEGRDAADEDSLAQRLAGVYFGRFFVENEAGVVVSAREFTDQESFLSLGFAVLEIGREELGEFLKSAEAVELLERFKWANEVAKNFGTPAFVLEGSHQIKPSAITSLEALEKLIKSPRP
ncbi:thiol:disulfide interchange protein DsbA/DsbL [Campylobacter sp.]|uniref:thiol:disulfide interchange protein DsbA/DsbL n=1 Tax=Campylobacter sp. TaxID=205 RepID=UPI0026DD5901|nr:thiol:disulfide interchange protein DsbA/DsbL [Campylobacter sp.]MDO4673869.1 thiol:disulfide interchange protein DsbA/DsbL [Campylobacter sp.]